MQACVPDPIGPSLALVVYWRTYEDDLEQHLLVDLHELLVPLIDIGGLLARVGIVICGSCGLSFVMLAPLDNLAEDGLVDLQKGMLVADRCMCANRGRGGLTLGMGT